MPLPPWSGCSHRSASAGSPACKSSGAGPPQVRWHAESGLARAVPPRRSAQPRAQDTTTYLNVTGAVVGRGSSESGNDQQDGEELHCCRGGGGGRGCWRRWRRGQEGRAPGRRGAAVTRRAPLPGMWTRNYRQGDATYATYLVKGGGGKGGTVVCQGGGVDSRSSQGDKSGDQG